MNTHEAYRFLAKYSPPYWKKLGLVLLAPEWWDQKGARLGVHLQLSPSAANTQVG